MMTPLFRVSLITFAVISSIHIVRCAPVSLGVSKKRKPDAPADLDSTEHITKDGTNTNSLPHDKIRKALSSSKTPINKATFGNMTKPSEADKLNESTLESKSRHRKRGDVFYQRRQMQLANKFSKKILDEEVNKTKEIDGGIVDRKLNRSKRWDNYEKDYDKEYDWENDGAENDVSKIDQKKDTMFEKIAKNWQKHALRFIFIFSIVMLFVGSYCAIIVKFFQKLGGQITYHLKEYRDVCLGRDPTYRMLRVQADIWGIDLPYEEYLNIKHSYDQALKKHGYSNVDLSGRQ